MNRVIGVILLVGGLAAVSYGAITYTTRETVVDIGPIHATREKSNTIPLPPVAGALALAAGVALLVHKKS